MKNQFFITLMCVFFILPAAAKDVKISFQVNGNVECVKNELKMHWI